jgi:hypothetical protein
MGVEWSTSFTDAGDQWAKAFVECVTVDRPHRRILASGRCPRCGDEVSFEITDDDVLPDVPVKTARRRLAPGQEPWGDETLKFRVWCDCDADHPGRPPDVGAGCGWNAIYRDSVDPQ